MRLKGPWSSVAVRAHLAAAVIPLRLAVATSTGTPLPMSLWFLPEADVLWCATRREARLVRLIEADPRCGFEVAGDAPPYRGVRGQGVASLHPERGAEVLRRLLARYGVAPDSRLACSLLAHAEREVAIRIAPEWMTSWDFAARMADAFD